MDCNLVIGIISSVIGGLCIFLLGMKYLSEGMQAIAGEKLRKMISAITDNRLMACGTGVAVTSLIQSSSVTTVIVVGMVNAGVMTLQQAVGVILGADIGTTVTAWIVALNVLEYGLPLLGIAGFFYLFSKNERVRYSAMMFLGLGMIFFGLELMKTGLEPIRSNDYFLTMFSKFEPKDTLGVIKCVLAGTLVTAIVQSSSATVAITITLARTDVIGFDTAVALVLGENIGTTITAFLSSLGTSTNARRAAYAHILMKTIGVSIMVPAFPHYLRLLSVLHSDSLDIAKRIAFSHSLFNIFLVCLFLPLVGVFSKLLLRAVPSKPHKEARHLAYLDVRLLESPAFGIQQSAGEMLQMGEHVQKMLGWLKTILTDGRNENLEKKVFHREEVLDMVQKEVTEYVSQILAGAVPHDVLTEARQQLRIADEYESVSDYIAAILKLHLKMQTGNLKPAPQGKADLLSLHDRVADYADMVIRAIHDKNKDVLSKAITQGDAITHMMKDFRQTHLIRVEQQHVSPQCSLVFTDMLTSYRRIKDHMLNIAEVLAGEK